MKKNSEMYQLVYEYYETRILLGFYTCHDKLPSIPKICEIFHFAPVTVHTALSLLEKNGYIKLSARRTAEVVFDASPETLRQNAFDYFIVRRQGVIEIAKSGALLLEPLWIEGLRRWSDEEWNALFEGILTFPQTPLSSPVEFYLFAINALNNRLALNLLWEVIRYLRFPYLANGMETFSELQEMDSLTKDEAIALFKKDAKSTYLWTSQRLFHFLDEAALETSCDTKEQIPFSWNIYRQRPQLRYSLSSRLIREIMQGKYPEGTYLPSLSQMVKLYGVPMMTVRRALEILEEFGFTKSYHGKGTQVYIRPVELDFTKSPIQEGCRFYLDSLQILALTIRGISFHTWTHAASKKKEALLKNLSLLLSEKKCSLCIESCLIFIEQESTLPMVQECYTRLRELLTWGYPLTLARFKGQNMDEKYETSITSIIQCLTEKSPEKFSAALETLLLEEEKCSRQFWTPYIN